MQDYKFTTSSEQSTRRHSSSPIPLFVGSCHSHRLCTTMKSTAAYSSPLLKYHHESTHGKERCEEPSIEGRPR